MELAGNEKPIQALFCELKLEDELLAPDFARVWSRARSAGADSRLTFKVSFAFAALLVIIALSSLVLWPRIRQAPEKESIAVLPAGAFTPAAVNVSPDISAISAPEQTASVKPRNSIKFNSTYRKLVARRQAAMLGARAAQIRNATAISSWQSPTASLLDSSVDEMLTTLPQLSESVKELKSFLPNKPNEGEVDEN